MASTITPTLSPSCSSSTPKGKYEVFLSFHGPDTRKRFTDHLYHALKEKGIHTFRDDKTLKQGEYISEGLLKAIQESTYVIVVISKSYAFSKWCLIELAEIVRCKKEMRLIVVPVFYNVDPSDVREQTRSFAKAFVKHEKDPKVGMKTIQTWRAALTEVGSISGWNLEADRSEAVTVRELLARYLVS
ncbi:TMV resistance protein N [Morella rubra]|uniref:TMV resistance protein N n=1 Tax=Morella rubra TaxID=262757 RepID=A0A6A1WTN3_9ROSI|nr:TMV resistance protein N [Morella rubra]